MNRTKIIILKISSVDGMFSHLICKFHSSGMWKETVSLKQIYMFNMGERRTNKGLYWFFRIRV